MNTRVFSAYNLVRGVLLNSRLTLADSGNQPLKLLDIVVSGMGMDPTKGLWLTPLHAIPAVPRVFPFDLIYLDKEYRVLETAEMGPGAEFPGFQSEVASALVLPSDILRKTGTAAGDRLIVCPATELDALLSPSGAEPAQVANPQIPHLPSVTSVEARSLGMPTIELVPERPVPVRSSRVVRGFEDSFRTALAKVENQTPKPVDDTPIERNPNGAQAPSSTANSAESIDSQTSALSSVGPSLDISDVVLERSNQVFAPIIEHRIDPEDLFSNWVVLPPSPPVGSGRPDPVPSSRPAVASAVATRNGNPNTAESSAADASGEHVRSLQTAAPEVDPPAPQPKSRAASGRSDKSAAKAKQSPEKPKQTPSKVAIPGPQNLPATTFTAVPYGMWQVSMPTAVTPVVKPAGSQKISSAQTPQTSPSQPNSTVEVPPQADLQSAASSIPVGKASPKAQAPIKPPNSKPEDSAETDARAIAAPLPKEFEAAPKPVLTAPDAAQKHTPGDFVASLQEKLLRVQHSKPEPAIPTPTSQKLENADPAPAAAVSELRADVPEATRSSSAKISPIASSRFLNPAPKEAPSRTDKKEATSDAAPSRPRSERATPEPPASSFRTRFKQWLNPVANPSDRRRAGRRYVPGMVAHYFTGGAPKPHEVADISMSGMYLLTDDRWMPGTMIQMTLQKPCARGERKQSINVLSRIVRRGSDGVAAEFVMSETLSRVSHDIQPSQATDKFALARFL